jgi:hypothetical protein
MNQLDTLLTQIAQQHLRIETLETRKSDSLDFHDLAVWCLRDALEAAFNAGVEQGRKAVKADKAGGTGDGYLCVEVTAPGRPYLYVNPEGGDYARYVARLG